MTHLSRNSVRDSYRANILTVQVELLQTVGLALACELWQAGVLELDLSISRVKSHLTRKWKDKESFILTTTSTSLGKQGVLFILGPMASQVLRFKKFGVHRGNSLVGEKGCSGLGWTVLIFLFSVFFWHFCIIPHFDGACHI